jgi:hypothetical protein
MKITKEAYEQSKKLRDAKTAWMCVDANGVCVSVHQYKADAAQAAKRTETKERRMSWASFDLPAI